MGCQEWLKGELVEMREFVIYLFNKLIYLIHLARIHTLVQNSKSREDQLSGNKNQIHSQVEVVPGAASSEVEM